MLGKNIIIGLIIIALILPVLSCGSNAGPTAMSLEYNGNKSEFSTNIYSYYLSHTKTRWLMDFINMYMPGTSIENMSDLPIWEDEELDAEVKAEAERAMMNMLAIAAYCKENNLALSSDQRNNIELFVREVIDQVYGRSRTSFNNVLARFHINDEIFREIKRYELMAGLVHRHLFDEDTGSRPVQRDDILAVYEPNFVRFKHIVIITQSSERGVDGEIIEYTDEQLAEIKSGAQDIYDQIIASGNDEELFAQLMAEHSADQMIPQGYTISEAMGLDVNLTQALFDLRIGGVSMVELEGSIHIMQRYELLDPEETPDLSNPTSSVAQSLARTFQQLILFDELSPYIENIVINTEETSQFSTRTSDTMFDIWFWLE